MKSNRLKAVLFINLSYFAMFFYNVFLKVAINEKGIHPFDLCLVRAVMKLILCGALIVATGQSFHVQRRDRCPMILRCVIDLCGYIGIIFGVPMVPLIVMSTIFQTAPFWASILGYFVLGETISCFEIVAMILSFGGMICICVSSTQHDDDAQAVVENGDYGSASSEAEESVSSIDGS